MQLRTLVALTGSACLILLLAACGGGGGDPPAPATYTVGVTVTGLAGAEQVTFTNNGGNPLTVTAAQGSSLQKFTTPVNSGSPYSVVVSAGGQPTGKTCTVANPTGTVSADVSLAVTCGVNAYTVGVTVTGLAGVEQVTLTNNGGNPLTVTAAQGGTLRNFTTPVNYGSQYSVIVDAGGQPTGKTCTVANPTGTVSADVSLAVTCGVNAYTVGVTVTGLAGVEQVTLTNNGGNPLTVTAAQGGTLRNFTTPVNYGSQYSVIVDAGGQPTGKTCTVANPTGTVSADVSLAVTCGVNAYTVGVTVTGLAGVEQVTLTNNGGNPLTVTAAQGGTLRNFTTPVNYGSQYSVIVDAGGQPTGKTCTVANPTGTVSADVSLAVTCGVNAYTVGGTISGLLSTQTVTLTNNGGNSLTLSAADGPSFAFTTPVNYGSGYEVAVGSAGQPTAEFCHVTNGTGTVVGNVTTVSVNCRLEIAYVANADSNTISQYTIGIDGALTPMANPTVATGLTPKTIAVDPKGLYAYVANAYDGTVSQYTIDANGALIPMSPATVPIGSGAASRPNTVVVDPFGRYVYVAAVSDQTVSQFAIGTDGTLTAVNSLANPPVSTGNGPLTMTIDPSGRFAYVSNYFDSNSTVSQYSIGPTNGLLTPMSSPTVIIGLGLQPFGITIDPAGKYAYVEDHGDYANPAPPTAGSILQYTIDTNGLLTTTGTPVATGHLPWPIVIDAAGQYAFWSNEDDGTLSKCAIGALGAFTNCTTSDATVGSHPRTISIDPSGRYLYVTNQGNESVSQYRIGAGALLTPIGSGSVQAEFSPTFITTIR